MLQPNLRRPEERRRERRFQIPDAAVTAAGETVGVRNMSTIGIACQTAISGVRRNQILPIQLALPRRAADRCPHRFTLLAIVMENNGRGLILRFIQPSRVWVRAMVNYLDAMDAAND